MAFATLNYHSRSLQKASSFNIIFPDDPAIPGPWATFYLLHGLSDDHTIWMRRTSIERYVGRLPLVVVMPDGGRGWYTNSVDGLQKYEDDLIKDVVGLVDRTFPVKAERAGRAIGGLSMGGYGAIKIGLKHFEMFASVSSHSGALSFPHLDPEKAKTLSPEFPRIFGTSAKGGPEDPFAIVERIDHGRIPAIRIDCGKEDFLIEQNRAFHKHLDDLHIRHEYEEYPGNHDWGYWDLHVREALAFHARNLGLDTK
ncbi:S-formylglutathione hydrolase FrmB [Singulisphaera sp. GP187]|uniref:alpha/beta hydrolase n=1 Tax=Singulisphaera sp. GP187 TaxID=1882752 RepID=UPI00092A5D65|nr:alpha/beta hydrolase family protein [Singulisphaera sp. GP187]SIO45695.1 S-formylglutathione hydrolase FrmB [Singulisphaera sp. GP187]